MIELLDFDDVKRGFAVGKAHKLAEWSHAKEEREFRKLCKRLYLAKWVREVKAEGGDRWARLVESWRRTSRRRHERKHAERVAAWEASLKVRPCPHCRTKFPTELRPGRPQKWCSRKCQNAARHAREGKARLASARKKREAARAALPPVFCESCGSAVERRTTKPRRFCEKRTCVVKAYRLRNLDACRERDRARRPAGVPRCTLGHGPEARPDPAE